MCTWSTTATSTALRYVDGVATLYAPFGMDDLLGMVVRANKM